MWRLLHCPQQESERRGEGEIKLTNFRFDKDKMWEIIAHMCEVVLEKIGWRTLHDRVMNYQPGSNCKARILMRLANRFCYGVSRTTRFEKRQSV